MRLGLSGKSKLGINDLPLIGREVALCGSAALSISMISDRLYFGFWTFPPYQWLNFNISQDLAIFYGHNRPDYYLTEGLPLLLTTYLPFALVALVKSTGVSNDFDTRTANIRYQLAFTVVTTVASLSLISHKEVRFIYPLLPLLHILLAPHISNFFRMGELPAPASGGLNNLPGKPQRKTPPLRRLLLTLLVIANIAISGYLTLVHQRGVLDVLTFLRSDFERLHLTARGEPLGNRDKDEIFAAFLMPCHSTPWRSHLVYPTLNAWALTCEPPLDISAGTPERAAYRDEADRFFDNPAGFLEREVGGRERPWPRYVVGFEGEKGLEDVLTSHVEEKMGGWTLKRKWEGFNSHFHDDSRRKGKVVVWETAQQ